MLLILLAIGFARWQGISDKQADAATVWQRDLVFADGPQGSVIVKDAQSQTEIAQFEGAQKDLSGALSRLLVVAEAYPTLTASITEAFKVSSHMKQDRFSSTGVLKFGMIFVISK